MQGSFLLRQKGCRVLPAGVWGVLEAPAKGSRPLHSRCKEKERALTFMCEQIGLAAVRFMVLTADELYSQVREY